MTNMRRSEVFKASIVTTIPVFLGYMAIGMAFGFMLVSAGYSWLLAPLMSIVIYAGACQYVAVPMFASNAAFSDIVIVTLLVNSRHAVYGLSLFGKFKNAGIKKYYMIFGLTDETYSILTTVEPPKGADPSLFYFFITLLDHFYWVLGGTIGAILVNIFRFDTKGVEFALTALFIVLMIEQFKNSRSKIPFVIAAIAAPAALIFTGPGNMLIISIVISIAILIVLRRIIEK